MRCEQELAVSLPAGALEREALAAAFDALAPLFDGVAGDGTALFVASSDAGTASTLRFWAEAQRTGVAFANPELFPWCLANAPGAALARRFGITGPNVTWLGGEDAVQAARSTAASQLADGSVARVCLVALDFGQADLRAWRYAPSAAATSSAPSAPSWASTPETTPAACSAAISSAP